MLNKVKKEYLVLLIIVIGLSLYLVTKDDNGGDIEIPELKEINKDSIQKIEINSSKGNLSLKVNKKVWSLEPEGYPVLENKTETMVKLLSKTDISDLISRAEKYDKFGLGKKNRTVVKAIGEKGALRELTIGNNAESGNRTFIKLKDDKIIYQARGNYKDSFNIGKDDIINKKIFNFNSSDIVELIYEKDNKAYHFVKIDENELTKKKLEDKDKKKDKKDIKKEAPKDEKKLVWVNESDKKKVNGTEIDSFLSKNSNINCEKFFKKKENKDKKGFINIVFIDKTKRKYTLNIYKELNEKKEEIFKLTSSDSSFIFSLSKNDMESINIDPEKLKKLEIKKKK